MGTEKVQPIGQHPLGVDTEQAQSPAPPSEGVLVGGTEKAQPPATPLGSTAGGGGREVDSNERKPTICEAQGGGRAGTKEKKLWWARWTVTEGLSLPITTTGRISGKSWGMSAR